MSHLLTRRGLVSATLRLNRLPAMRRITGLPYDACVAALGQLCARIPTVRSLYIPRDYRARRWMPASSDLDLLLVLHAGEPPELEARALDTFWRELRGLGRVFPFLSTGLGSVPVFTEDDLALPHFGWRGVALPSHAPPHSWTLIYGEEVRPLIRSWEPSPPRQVPASPDLHGLLDKHLHPKIMARRPAPASYLGSELRLAHKLVRCLLHRQNSDTPAPSNPERLAAWLEQGHPLDPDGQLGRLLGRLERGGGYTRRARASRARLGFLLMRAMDRYNAELVHPLGAAPLPPGQTTPPPLASRLAAALAQDLPAGVSALLFPHSHLLGPAGPVDHRPRLGLVLVLNDLNPGVYEQTLALVGRLKRDHGATLQPRVMGPHTWAASMSLCGTNYPLESFHLRRTNLMPRGLPAPVDPAQPAPRTLHLAMLRRLTVERCHMLRSCLDRLRGQPAARLLNALASLASCRLYLAGAPPLTVASEILAAHEAAFPGDGLARRVTGLCRISPAAPINRTLLLEYRACALDMLEASCPAPLT